MSKKNKVIKLGSKKRDKGKDYLVTFNGVQMTRIEREALLRAQAKTNEPEPAPTGKKAKKGTKVAEPRHSKLFNLLHPKKKQTAVPDLKSVENTAPVVEKKPEPEPEPVEEKVEEKVEIAPEPTPAPEPVPAEDVVTGDDDFVEEEDDGEEDDLSEELNLRNAKKRISPRFVMRVAKISAKSCDDFINAEPGLDKKIAAVDAEIKKAKTPKDATEEVRAEFNEKRKALRADKKKLELEKSTSRSKAEALEHASDGYCDIFKLLTGKVLQVRKTERLNEYHPLTEEQELEVLNSLWADKSARKAPKKKS
jgi:hypothetical protein